MARLLLAVPLLLGHTLAAQVSDVGQDSSQSAQPVGHTDEASEPRTYGDESTPAARQPLDASQLEQLVAPIALYPDALVAQVLAASTYPAQVEQADRWRQEQAYASPAQIASGAAMQPWDASVKALTAFPQVLAQMDRNLQWTTDLGNAYYNQSEDVLEAVQVMRARAQAAGNLRSTPQEAVQNDGGNIVVAPADPQVVYVPAYNPWAVYGAPIAPYPGFSLLGAVGDFFASSAIRFGLGIAMTAFTHAPWGWLAWGLDWLAHSLMFHGAGYYSHSGTVAHWGFPPHRFYAYSGRVGIGRGNAFARVRNDGWRRGADNSGGWHEFGGSSERGAGSWGERGFQPFHGQPGRMASNRFRSNGTVAANRGERGFGSNRGGAFNSRAYHRSGELRGSPSFARASGKSRGRGSFGGGGAQRGFGRSGAGFRGGAFHGGGGHAPKFHGGSSRGGRSHGGGHGGGHSHGHHH